MATEMLDAGAPIVVIARRLDHARESTTLDHHAHSVPGRDAAELLARRIRNAKSESHRSLAASLPSP